LLLGFSNWPVIYFINFTHHHRAINVHVSSSFLGFKTWVISLLAPDLRAPFWPGVSWIFWDPALVFGGFMRTVLPAEEFLSHASQLAPCKLLVPSFQDIFHSNKHTASTSQDLNYEACRSFSMQHITIGLTTSRLDTYKTSTTHVTWPLCLIYFPSNFSSITCCSHNFWRLTLIQTWIVDQTLFCTGTFKHVIY
jgi:hypothetical protein